MGRFQDGSYKELNKNQDDSFCSERSEDNVFRVVLESANSPSVSSFPQTPLNPPHTPVLLRGRVHHYSSVVKAEEIVVQEGIKVFDDNKVNFVQKMTLLEKTHKIVTKDEVLSSLNIHVSSIRLGSSSCLGVKARLNPSPPAKASPAVAESDVTIERARLASTNCQNKLFILYDLEPLECHSSPAPVSTAPSTDMELGCCSSPPVVTAPSTVSPAALTPYTIDREQLFPGAVFDSHCHLDFIYRRLRGEVDCSVHSLQDCLDMDGLDLGTSFGGCVANFCQPSDWAQGRTGRLVSAVIKNSARDSRIFMTIGCHPHYADRILGNRMDQLRMLVSGRSEYPRAKVVALGECGLDYSKKNTVDKAVQKQVFTDQLNIALKYKMPLVLHIRDAEADGYAVLRAAGVPTDWPIHRHCFTGDWDTASTWLDQFPGSKIGVTAMVTYQEAGRVRQVVKNIPLDRLLLETDAPYFLPARTDRARYPWNCALPGHVIHVAAQVASIKGVQLRTVLEQNLMNVHEIYNVGRVGGAGTPETMEGVEGIRAK